MTINRPKSCGFDKEFAPIFQDLAMHFSWNPEISAHFNAIASVLEAEEGDFEAVWLFCSKAYQMLSRKHLRRMV